MAKNIRFVDRYCLMNEFYNLLFKIILLYKFIRLIKKYWYILLKHDFLKIVHHDIVLFFFEK